MLMNWFSDAWRVVKWMHCSCQDCGRQLGGRIFVGTFVANKIISQLDNRNQQHSCFSGASVDILGPRTVFFEPPRFNHDLKKYGRFTTHCTTHQASEDQQQFVVFCRGAHLFDDQKHQSCPGRGLERTHLP